MSLTGGRADECGWLSSDHQCAGTTMCTKPGSEIGPGQSRYLWQHLAQMTLEFRGIVRTQRVGDSDIQ